MPNEIPSPDRIMKIKQVDVDYLNANVNIITVKVSSNVSDDYHTIIYRYENERLTRTSHKHPWNSKITQDPSSYSTDIRSSREAAREELSRLNLNQ